MTDQRRDVSASIATGMAAASAATRAAKYARAHSVSCASAAHRFGTTTDAAIAAWNLLYPNEFRSRT